MIARMRGLGFSALLLYGLFVPGGRIGAQALAPPSQGTPQNAPVHLTAEQDRRRMLDLLGIKELRPEKSSNAKAPNGANYDEAKANQYPNLPDPLTFNDSGRVTTAAQWWTRRRPEIVKLFNDNVLGRAPENLPSVKWETVSSASEDYEGFPVTTTRLAGHVDNAAYPQIGVTIDVELTLPANAKGPVPVIIELAFASDFARAVARPVSNDPGNYAVRWQPVLKRGWGFAVLNPASFQADDGAGLTAGIIGLMNKGQPRGVEDWGALRAWAWGAGRFLDYLATLPAVDAKRVGIEGHSRFGKAALVTMAYDRRFAIAYISSSGEGGAKLYRHIFGEPIMNVASVSEYHWMAGSFLQYAGPLTPGDLPVDNHELIALCAPRPVFIGGGASVGDGYADPSGDGWADSRGMFLAEVAASPVYELLGVQGLGASEFPPVGTALTAGELGFRQHPGGHSPAPNWPAFLDFADKHLREAGSRSPGM